MNDLTLEALRREHGAIRALNRQFALVGSDLRFDPNPAIRSVLDSLLETCVRHLFRHMRQEEQMVYPELTRVLGLDVPALYLTAEHRSIRIQVYDLQSLNSGRASRELWSDRVPALRQGVHRLGTELELHLRREEAAFGALRSGSLVA